MREHITGAEDVFAILQRILLRENKVSLGSVNAAIVTPSEVFTEGVTKVATSMLGKGLKARQIAEMTG